MLTPVKIGISSCLLGNKVRYDGGHSHDRFLTQTLGLFIDYIPVCPEVECGMPTPREAVRLVGLPENPRIVTQKTGIDKTDQMNEWIKRRLRSLEKENLCGFIFRSKSPSSGLYRIKVYGDDGQIRKTGTGFFARAFIRAFPRVPVEEAGRLNDPHLRELFVESIFSFQRWRDLINQNKALGGLVDFHTRNKYLILSHSHDHYRKLGKLVAHGKQLPIDRLFDEYEALLLAALRLKATVSKNINVLKHMIGFFKRNLSSFEKEELIDIIAQYRSGYVPLIVPITLINHYVMKYDQPWLKVQTYLNPHPIELKLRNYF